MVIHGHPQANSSNFSGWTPHHRPGRKDAVLKYRDMFVLLSIWHKNISERQTLIANFLFQLLQYVHIICIYIYRLYLYTYLYIHTCLYVYVYIYIYYSHDIPMIVPSPGSWSRASVISSLQERAVNSRWCSWQVFVDSNVKPGFCLTRGPRGSPKIVIIDDNWQKNSTTQIKNWYPLVNVYITMENHHFLWVHQL